MNDYSIEYAHIYSNSKIGKEQGLSIDILGKLSKELNQKSASSSLVIMVDDYSFPDPTFDYNAFAKWLAEKGFTPDLIIRESQLIPLCDLVLSNITDVNLRANIEDYIKAKKYPCSLFIAAWYLLRMGELKLAGFDENICAMRLINILPESFKPFEEKGIEIIKKSKFAGCEKFIEYKYFDGRILA